METIDIVLGAQFGDEGKGRIVNYLCASGKYKVCARFNGSDNAGHTAVMDSGKKIAFRQIPVGAAYGMICVIGRGCILDLDKLEAEIGELKRINGDWSLYIDSRCHIKTPGHRQRDMDEEKSRSNPIGTTLSGNGPAYADKYARENFRLCDVNLDRYPDILRKVLSVDTSLFLSLNEPILVEGAHGIMLDIDHGTYPFVTSSGCTAGAACHSLGIAPHRIGRVIGVIKPYATRVGAGAMPTEILDTELASTIREAGGEYGTNTERARRIGWLDLQALAYSVRVGGITEIALTKIDILNELDLMMNVCVGYKGIVSRYVPPRDSDGKEVSPRYILMRWDEARLVDLIEEHIGVPVTMVSCGVGKGTVKTRLT